MFYVSSNGIAVLRLDDRGIGKSTGGHIDNMKQIIIMKYILFSLLILFICGCTTLNKNLIKNTERLDFQPLVLIPDYDICDIRIDIIRQTSEKQVNNSTTETEEYPYHPNGFYLGNGLFFDLNDNLSLLVPKLLDISCDKNFKIKHSHQGSIFKSATTYEKIDSLLVIRNRGLINTNTKKKIINNDSIVFVKAGLFSKYRIIKADSSITYQTGLLNTTIYKNKNGYFHKTLFGKKEYRLTDNEILIGKRYILRNHGDTIEILAKGLFNNEYLKYRIIKSDNKKYVYDRNYRGLEIHVTKNEIDVIKNRRNINRYSTK
ncbi:MAG: hypothetical protein ACOCXH_05305 [Cyclobacteriaceae bacterium]